VTAVGPMSYPGVSKRRATRVSKLRVTGPDPPMCELGTCLL
jgi:hypothetical protein